MTGNLKSEILVTKTLFSYSLLRKCTSNLCLSKIYHTGGNEMAHYGFSQVTIFNVSSNVVGL